MAKPPRKPEFWVRYVTKIETLPDATLKVSATKGIGPFETLEEAQNEVRRGIREDWRFAGWVAASPMGKASEALWGTQREEAKCCPAPESHRLKQCPVARERLSGVVSPKPRSSGGRSKQRVADPSTMYWNHRTWHGCNGDCEEAKRLWQQLTRST